MENKVYITPCCKTRHWITPYRNNLPGGNYNGDIIKCELCGKEFEKELLEKVVYGLNPTTFFCDRCHTSVMTEINHTTSVQAERARILAAVEGLRKGSPLQYATGSAGWFTPDTEIKYNDALEDVKKIIKEQL